MLAEKDRLERGEYPESCSLVMRNMKKRFGRRKIAVKGVSLAIEVHGPPVTVARSLAATVSHSHDHEPSVGAARALGRLAVQRGIVFGLLGPNGAGRRACTLGLEKAPSGERRPLTTRMGAWCANSLWTTVAQAKRR